jgi:hypothetical protein
MISKRCVRQVALLGLVFASAIGSTGAYAQPAPSATASVTPSAFPSSQSPPESPSPLPTASPRAVAIPIVVRARVGIVPGTTVVVSVSGGNGTIAVSPSSPNVDVRYDPIGRSLTLVGRAPGTTMVTLSDAAGDTATVDVLVAAAAGVVPSDVSVELGGTVAPQFAATKIAAAIAAIAQLRPGARVDVQDATPGATLRPGDTLEATAHVRIDGAGTFVDVTGATSVHLRVETLSELDPQILFYSDDPEKLLAGTDGVLYRATLDAAKPARTYFYHVAYGSTHRLFLALRATGADAHVQILGYAAGPSNAFAYVGHVATVKYLLARQAQESSIVPVTADAPYVQQLGAQLLQPGELVAGALDLRVLDGGPVDVDVISTEPDADPTTFFGAPELPTDGHGRRGEFDLTTVPPLALAYAVGSPDPDPFEIGSPTIANLRPDGRPLGGDYGVLRNVSLQLNNPSAAPASVYFYELPSGGSATTTIWFSGDLKPTEIPCVVRQNRYTIAQYDLAPGETRVVTGEYMTDGASSFPLLFGLTGTPPSPPPGPYSPDACNPRTPPPATPSPGTSASAVPSTPPANETPPVPPPPPLLAPSPSPSP